MADKNTPAEASNIFHSIIKASVKPKLGQEICPTCGSLANLISHDLVEDRVLMGTYKCPKDHQFSEMIYPR